MKKVFSVLLVAVLAVSTVFAGFGGKASIGVGANLDNGNFGFISQGSGVNIDVELSTAEGEKAGEGSVYASIKGSMELVYLGGFGKSYDHSRVSNSDFGINAAVTEAKIGGENWSVSILGMPNGPDYAKSAIDTGIEDKKDDWGRPTYSYNFPEFDYAAPYAKVNGVTAEAFGYKVGFGLLGDFSKADKKANKLNFAVFAETPEYDFNGVTVQAGTTYAYNEFEKLKDGVPTNGDKYAPTNGMGLSAKVGYANDVISASVATDMGFNFLEGVADKDKFNADVAANFTYDFVSVDAYYATVAASKFFSSDVAIENLLSTAVAVDLNAFDVPVALSIVAADLINTQDLSAEVVVNPIDGLELSVNGGYIIDVTAGEASKKIGKWSCGLGAEYKNDLFKAKAGVDMEQLVMDGEKLVLGANASIESTALIDGAKLKLAWTDAKDLLKADNDGVKEYGKIVASCEIKF